MANIASLDQRIEPTDQNCNGDVYATCQDTHFDSNGNIITDDYGDDCIDYSYFQSWCDGYDTATFVSG